MSSLLSTSTRAFFATGTIASSVVLNLTSSFILLYYSRVLGAPPALVGATLAIALIFDGVSDPIIGYMSDHTKSRWGRRHPYMYIAVVPVALLCWAVWNPPSSLGPIELVLYLIATIVPLRIALSVFEVPNVSLTAELTDDYDERTKLAVYRTCTSWLFLTTFTALVYGYWLQDSPDYPDGVMNPEGYGNMSIAASLLVLAAMLVSSIGLHRLIPRFSPPSSEHHWSFGDLFLSFQGVLTERALVPLFLSGAAISTGFAVYGALFAIYYHDFWGLNSLELSFTQAPFAFGALVGIFAAPYLNRFREKRTIVILATSLLCVSVATPVLLGFLGLAPISGGTAGYFVIYGFLFVDMVTYVLVHGTIFSMITDAVEHRALLREGRREEGTIFAVQTFVLKASSALGVLFAGMALQVIGFADEGVRADPEFANKIGLTWVGLNLAFYFLGICPMIFYRFTRQRHLENIVKLSNDSEIA
jgi:GPH family glycoside/pentoside/hexuronide:cation symporter